MKLRWLFLEPPRGKGKGAPDSLEVVAFYLKVASFVSIGIWVSLAIYQIPPGNTVPVPPAAISLLSALGLAAASQVFNYAGQRRARAGIKDVRGVLCLGCGFDLRQHGESGRCPECGREFVRQKLVEEWNRTYPELGMEVEGPNPPPTR